MISVEGRASGRGDARAAGCRVRIAVVAVLTGLALGSCTSGDGGAAAGDEAVGDEATDVERDERDDRDESKDSWPTDGPRCTKVVPQADVADDPGDREPPDPEPPSEDTPADALECETLFSGEGEGAVEGDVVTVHYVGKLPDGTVFDTSWPEGGEPFEFTLGQGQVITGWDEGMQGARVGERRRLVIGSDNAYGSAGAGSIPPNTPLAFEVDVLAIDTGP